MSRATFTERASPSTPSTGKASLFVKTDKGIYLIDDTGLETQLLRTASALTAGGVVFASGAGVLANDPTKLFWDDTNNRLGIGTNTPSVALDVVGTLAVTKATAGDSGIFTNGGASNKSVYIYTDDTNSGLFSIANAAGGANGYYWNNNTDTHHWQINGLGSRMNLSSTGLAVTGALSATGTITTASTALSGYKWDSWNPSDVIGSATNAPSTGTSDDSAFTSAANSSGTLTLTFDVAGRYLVTLTGQTAQAITYTFDRMTFNLGGTATRRSFTNSPSMAGDSANSSNFSITTSFIVIATAGQTLTVLPTYELTGAGTTAQHVAYASVTAAYLGG